MTLIHHQLWMGENIAFRGMLYPTMFPLLYTWLFTSLGRVDQVLASSIQVVFLLMLILAVFQMFRTSNLGSLSFLACLFFLLSSTAIASQFDCWKGIVDFPLFVSSLTLMYFIFRFWRNPSTTNAMAAGILGGLTGAIKQLGLVFVLVGGVLIMLKSLQDRRQGRTCLATHFAAYATVALAFSAPYYIYSFAQFPTETITYFTPAISSTLDLTTLLKFGLATLRGLYTQAWGLAPIIAVIGINFWRRILLGKIVLFWMIGSVFLYYLFVSATGLGSLETMTLSDPRYALAIFSLFAVLAGCAIGSFWHKAQGSRRIRRSIYSIIIVILLIGNVAMNVRALPDPCRTMQHYLLPPFITLNGTLVDRSLDEKYVVELGSFYPVAMYINEKTEPGSAIIIPGYYRFFFFNGGEQRKLYGEARKALWTSDLTELRRELRNLNSSYIYVVEEPWYRGFVQFPNTCNCNPFDYYFQSALYVHRNEIMSVVFQTSDGYVIYQVNHEFFAR